MNAIYFLQRLFYEAPATVAFGPAASAVLAGYAVVIGGELYLTPDGERYLDQTAAMELAA